MLHTKPSTELSERWTVLVYELLDAHDETARLASELARDLRWQVHLDYLRDLQRVGREELACLGGRTTRAVTPSSFPSDVLRQAPRSGTP